jgi:hypothetical protein
LQLTPRFASTLHPVVPEIGDSLVEMLLGEFRFYLKKKTQDNLESKARVSSSLLTSSRLLTGRSRTFAT